MFKAPAFMFPTKTLLFDDDLFYAELVAANLEEKISITPQTTIDLLRQQASFDVMVTSASNDQREVKQNIKKHVFKKSVPTDDVISVVIADEHMGANLGSSLLHQLKSPFTRKILISNFISLSSSPHINHLRNTGSIHAVLDKTENLLLNLPAVIQENKVNFFRLLSEELFGTKCNPLTDTSFSSAFIKIIQDFDPDYIWPEPCLHAFSLLNEKAKTTLKLFVSTSEQIDSLFESHRVESAPLHVQSMLKSYEYVIAHSDALCLDGHAWEKYLRPAKKITGQTTDYLFCTEMENHYV